MRPHKNAIEIRRDLHQIAEPSGKEVQTREYLLDFFQSLSPKQIIHFNDNFGFAAIFDSGKAGPVVGLRVDMDALCVHEGLSIPYASKDPHISHKCGHDGHMAIACATAQIVSHSPPKTGKIIFLFQPEEETGTGAKKIVFSSAYQALSMDYLFGFHNIPGAPSGQVLLSKDIFSCTSAGLEFELNGETSHAAQPKDKKNPTTVLEEVLKQYKNLMSLKPDDDFKMITLVHTQMGDEDYGTTPGWGKICFTLRAKRNKVFEKLQADLTKLITDIGRKQEIIVQITQHDYFPALKVTPALNSILEKTINELCGSLVYIDFPFTWSEDFSYFTQTCQATYFGLGIGDSPPLHHPDYDFNDIVIERASQTISHALYATSQLLK